MHRLPQFLLRGFWDELLRRGVPIAELARASGLEPPQAHDFVSRVTVAEMHRLFAAGVAATGDEQLGLTVGRALGASSFHLLGMIVLASPTLEHAMNVVARAQPQLVDIMPTLRDFPDGRVRFGRTSDTALATGARVEADIMGVLLHDTVLPFLDVQHGPPTMEFPFGEPRDRAAYQRTFSGDVQFGGEGVFCIFAKSALRPRSGVDRELLKKLFQLAQDQYGAWMERDTWAERVRRMLHAHPAPRLLDAPAVSALLKVSRDTLARRLSQEHTTLSRLMDEALYERAQASLDRGAPPNQVADELGYAELSSFYRAFRRWSAGSTPRKRAR